MQRLTCYHEIVRVEQLEFDIVVPDDATDEQIKKAAEETLERLVLDSENPDPYNDKTDEDYSPGEIMPSLMNDITVFKADGSRLTFNLNDQDDSARWFGVDSAAIGLKPSDMGVSIYVNDRNFAPFELDTWPLKPENLDPDKEPHWQLCVYFPGLDEPIAKIVWLGDRVVAVIDQDHDGWTQGADAQYGFSGDPRRELTMQFKPETHDE